MILLIMNRSLGINEIPTEKIKKEHLKERILVTFVVVFKENHEKNLKG